MSWYTSRHGWMWWLVAALILIAISFMGLVVLHWNGWGVWVR
jgi:hypothetical protein